MAMNRKYHGTNKKYDVENRKSKSCDMSDEKAKKISPEEFGQPSTSGYKNENVSKNIPTGTNIQHSGNLVLIANNECQNNLTINIAQDSNSGSDSVSNLSITEPIIYGLPLMMDNIIGREEDARTVLTMLQAADAKPVAICGIGGIGKTSLSYYCAQQWIQQKIIQDVAVFNSETKHDLTKSIEGFAERLQMKIGKIPPVEILRMIYDRYKDSEKTILCIYDNVEKYSDIRNYLAPDHINIYVIATSQNRELSARFHIYRIQQLTYDSSLELLNNLITEDLKDVEKLASTFQGLPLGLRQAAAYIVDKRTYENTKYTIKEYLDHYNDLLDKLPDDLQINYSKSLYVSLTINIDKVDNVKAVILLHCIAYLDPADISVDMFDAYNYDQLEKCNYFSNKAELDQALRILQKYSLILVTKNSYIQLHRIVQQFCQKIMSSEAKSRCLIILLTLCNYEYISRLNISAFHHIIVDIEPDVLTRCLEQVFRCGCKNFMNYVKDKQFLNIDLQIIMQQWNPYHYLFCLNLDHDMMEMMTRELSIKEACTPFNNTSSWLPIHAVAAFSNKSVEIYHVHSPIEFFLRFVPNAKADINVQTDEGLTPLHLAAALNQYENVRFLIEKGCDVHLKDNQENTAFSLAEQYSNVYILQELIESNNFDELLNKRGHSFIQSFNSRSKKYKTCLNILKSTSGTEIRKLLIIWNNPLSRHWKVTTDTMAWTLDSCSWWNEQEKALLPELMSMLDNTKHVIYIARAYEYMEKEKISVSGLLELLRKDEPHPVLDVVTEESLYPAARPLFKMICLAIDAIEKKKPKAYNILCIRAFFYGDIFCNSFADVQFLESYSLYDRSLFSGDLPPLVGCVARTYVSVRNETRQVLQQVLRLAYKPLSDKVSKSNEQINEFLKTFYFMRNEY